MSAFLNPPGREFLDGGKEANEIREIFYQHWEKMKNQMATAHKEIKKWRDCCIKEINKYADEQMRIINDDYDRQRLVFDERRRENIDTAIACIHRTTAEADLFDELRNECRRLQFDVAKLETFKFGMDYIRVITVEDQLKKKRENSTITQSIKTEDNTSKNVQSSSNPTSASSNRTNSPQSPTKETSNNDGSSISSDSNRKIHRTQNDGLDDKCPVCFMIYPSIMTRQDRSMHAEDHFQDDRY